ncbi:hypothetical protein [Actinomadura rudentiformis]|uniref:Uncharacterized protein n=1 Tax=Actinomadura rudentiformis TaxID=359158 RepID=A0A6H9YJI9_9ACTN|nr:hypothetical protein [Actinomadura rudentiformis]KAB2340122.1 hypothetical protein F8566_45445 [Actinomadura rudentiformis]
MEGAAGIAALLVLRVVMGVAEAATFTAGSLCGIVQHLDPALVMLAHEGTKRGPRRAHPHRCDGWR